MIFQMVCLIHLNIFLMVSYLAGGLDQAFIDEVCQSEFFPVPESSVADDDSSQGLSYKLILNLVACPILLCRWLGPVIHG
jgi:hypothetical protein